MIQQTQFKCFRRVFLTVNIFHKSLTQSSRELTHQTDISRNVRNCFSPGRGV